MTDDVLQRLGGIQQVNDRGAVPIGGFFPKSDQRAETAAVHERGLRQIEVDVFDRIRERRGQLRLKAIRSGSGQFLNFADIQCVSMHNDFHVNFPC